MATPDGVLAWWRAMRSAAWLPSPWLEDSIRPRVREPDGRWYGYGWNLRDTSLGPVVEHSGQVLGFTVWFAWYPELDLMIYINSADVRFRADQIVF